MIHRLDQTQPRRNTAQKLTGAAREVRLSRYEIIIYRFHYCLGVYHRFMANKRKVSGIFQLIFEGGWPDLNRRSSFSQNDDLTARPQPPKPFGAGRIELPTLWPKHSVIPLHYAPITHTLTSQESNLEPSPSKGAALPIAPLVTASRSILIWKPQRDSNSLFGLERAKSYL